MTARYGAPAPDGVRHLVRASHHPARAVECPHCGAHAHAPCTTKSKRHRLSAPVTTPLFPAAKALIHDSRITAWARATAVCPACQVEPGVECFGVGGVPLRDGDVHPQRQVEAGVTV